MADQQIHQTQPILQTGTPLEDAKVAVVMLHGRGDSARGILSLSTAFNETDGIAFIAPNASGQQWYPTRFIAPRQDNEPYLSSALATINGLLKQLETAGIPSEKTVILGFSQGACLATEVVARNPKHFGGVIAFSGGLIGAEGELEGYQGTLEGTPVFLGCSDVDFHIPVERVHATRDILTELGATVDERIYAGMGHTINDEEIQVANTMMTNLL